MSRKILDVPRVLAAAPSYLAERGVPTVPSDLSRHALIAGPAHRSTTLSFRRDGRLVSVRADSQLTVTINEGVVASAAVGLGIAVSSMTGVRHELEDETLVQVLPDWDLGSMEINALFVSGKTVKPAARAFADFLEDKLLSGSGCEPARPRCSDLSGGTSDVQPTLPLKR